MRCTQGTCSRFSQSCGNCKGTRPLTCAHTHADRHARRPLFSPCCHVLKCPQETLNTSLRDSVVPDIDLTPCGWPELGLTASHVTFCLWFHIIFQPGERGREGDRQRWGGGILEKHSVLIFQNVEGEWCLCCARGQIFFFSPHSSWPDVHIQPLHTFLWVIT